MENGQKMADAVHALRTKSECRKIRKNKHTEMQC
jgi:hypothetical protein